MLNQKGKTVSGIYLEIYSTKRNASLYKESKNKEGNKEKSKKVEMVCVYNRYKNNIKIKKYEIGI